MLTWLKKYGLEAVKIINVITTIIGGGSIQKAIPSSSAPLQTADSDLVDIATIITDIETAFAGAATVVAAPSTVGAQQASVVSMLPVKTGPLKLAAAIPLVAQKYARSRLMVGQKIKDHALYMSAMKTITSGHADLLNSLNPDVLKSEAL